jgi:DNA-binding NtrC family response regulator
MCEVLQHSWPGNVRELENVISSAALQCMLESAGLKA